MVKKIRVKDHLRGYTLIEILIVISLIGILSIGILSTLQNLYREERGGRTFLKSEMDVQMFLSYIKKFFSSIGYGVPLGQGNVTSARCDTKPILGYDDINKRFCFLSTAIRQKYYSGCWWICGVDGIWKTTATNFFGIPCPDIGTLTNDTQHNWFLYLDSGKSIYTHESNPICDVSRFHYLAYYLGRDETNNPYFFPDNFSAELYKGNNSVKGCAPQTFQINLKVGEDIAQPLVNCVADFRVRAIIKNTTSSSVFTGGIYLKDLYGIRFCMILQVGTRRSSKENFPNYSAECGVFSPPDSLRNEWEYYRWRVIEFNTPLYNLMLPEMNN